MQTTSQKKEQASTIQFVHTKVNTKSLLGRSALIGQLQESKKGSPDQQRHAGTSQQSPSQIQFAKTLEDGGTPIKVQTGEEMAEKAGRSFGFNNNIYNNYTPKHSIDYVSPAKRLLPRQDQHRVDLIKRLKLEGKIKSMGRSPVPLYLYEEADAKDHLYITKVTKHVPVAHDQQLQSEKSKSSPRTKQGHDVLTSRDFTNTGLGGSSKYGRDTGMASPQLIARQELQAILNQGFTITDNRFSKADAKESFHRSLDSFNKQANGGVDLARMRGEVNITLPPGYGLKQVQQPQDQSGPTSRAKDPNDGSPARQKLSASLMESSGQDAFNYNAATNRTVGAKGSMETVGVDGVGVSGYVASGATIPNQGLDSLFQEPSHDQSMIDQNAQMTQNSRQPPLMQSSTEFQQSQGFRSIVRNSTHQEISKLIKAANPSVYEQQRILNAEKQGSKSKQSIQERKDSFAAALRNNKWHAPVKKTQIFQSVLDGSNEPSEQPIDVAILAHQIQKFGTEQDANYEKLISSQRERGQTMKYGTHSVRKQTIAKMLEYNRLKEAEAEALRKTQGMASNDASNVTSPLTTSPRGIEDTATPRKAGIFGGGLPTVGALLSPSSKFKSPINGVIGDKPPNPTGMALGGLLSSIKTKQVLASKLRTDFTNVLLGKQSNFAPGVAASHNSTISHQGTNELPSSRRQDSEIDSSRNAPLLPAIQRVTGRIGDSTIDGESTDKASFKVKPQLLAKRRARMQLKMGLRKQSTQLLVNSTLQRSSKMSFHSNTQKGAFATLNGTSFSQPRSSTMLPENLEQENAQANLDIIQDMIGQLEVMNQPRVGGSRAQEFRTLQPPSPTATDLKRLKANFGGQPIFDITMGGVFEMTQPRRKPTSKKLSLAGGQKLKYARGSTIDVTNKKEPLSPLKRRDSLLPERLRPGKRSKRHGSKSRSPSKSKLEKARQTLKSMTVGDIEAIFCPQPVVDILTGDYKTQSDGLELEKQSMAQAAEKEELAETFKSNNEIIRELMRQTALLLQRPDSEARFLRSNVVQPANLKGVSLRPYVGKTIMLNVGQLYQPLRFVFNDHLGDFKVFFSLKTKVPNDDNGFDQKAQNTARVVFPQSQEHMGPNMLRFPKDKVLYITFESTHECAVQIQMEHNKKDAPDMTVASAALADTSSTMILSQHGSASQLSGSVTNELSEAELEQKALMTIETLKLMLGGEQTQTLHATKLNQIVKKKVKYMIKEDLEVAKDFLDLVDILKEHKYVVNKALKEEIARGKNKSPMQTDTAVLVENQTQQETVGADNLFDGFRHLFSNDYYRLFKEGQISRGEYIEARQQATKQKKQELDEMNRIRTLRSVTTKARRGHLQEQIITTLNKRASDTQFVQKWQRAMAVYKVCMKVKQSMIDWKAEIDFRAAVFWTVMKLRMRMGTKLKRQGPTPDERLRRQIKNSLNSIGSGVHLKELTAQNTLRDFFQAIQTRGFIKFQIIDTGKWVRRIQERFRSYWQVRLQQIDFLVRMINRERERLQISCIKDSDQSLRGISFFCGKLTEASMHKVAFAYYQACQFTYEPIFFAWRNKIHSFQEQGLEDMNDGWQSVFMQPRGVKSMDEVNYDLTYRKASLENWLRTASRNCRGRNTYYMNAEDEESETHGSIENASLASSKGAAQRRQVNRQLQKREEAKNRKRLRKQNPEFACLEDAILKQEEQFKTTKVEGLDNCVYYPPRPALKFLPTPQMIHQLLHQAIMIQFRNIEAPESWRELFDIGEAESLGSKPKVLMKGETTLETPQRFKAVGEQHRLTSRQGSHEKLNEMNQGYELEPSMIKSQESARLRQTLDGHNSGQPALLHTKTIQNEASQGLEGATKSKFQPRELKQEQQLGDDDRQEQDAKTREDEEQVNTSLGLIKNPKRLTSRQSLGRLASEGILQPVDPLEERKEGAETPQMDSPKRQRDRTQLDNFSVGSHSEEKVGDSEGEGEGQQRQINIEVATASASLHSGERY